MEGFYNKVLHVELGQGSFEEESIGDEIYRTFLGGKGLGTYLLLGNTKAGVDPLSEDNALIFAIGRLPIQGFGARLGMEYSQNLP